MDWVRKLCLALALSGGSSASGPLFSDELLLDQQWALPNSLREISGLALTPDERLFAVTDEVAIVYELDYLNGRLLKSFALGDPVIAGDFEGIAVLGDQVWLMTSDGVLYSTTEGENGERMPYRKYKTAMHKKCEFEGLTEVVERNSLLVLCKKPHKGKKSLTLYEWSPARQDVQSLKLPRKAMAHAIGKKRIRPSGVEIDPATGDLMIVAAAQRAVFRLSADAEFIGVDLLLPKSLHRQTEGIAITKDSRLLLSDEAKGDRARLSVYKPGKRD